MKCPEFEILEYYALGTIEDPGLHRQIEMHAAECAACRACLHSLKKFGAFCDQLSENQLTHLTNHVLERLNLSAYSILLFPVSESKQTSQYMLAAESRPAQRFVNIQSFSNQDQDVLVRLIKDIQKNKVTLYLLSENPNLCNQCYIEIEESEKYFPDKQGKVQLPAAPAKPWDEIVVKIKTAKAAFDLEPLTDLKERIISEGRYIVRKGQVDQIQLEVEDRKQKRRIKIRVLNLDQISGGRAVEVVVLQQDGQFHSSITRQGVAVFESLDLGQVIHIQLY